LKYRHVTPGYDITELTDTDMVQLRIVCMDLRTAELAAAKEHDRVKAAAKAAADAPAQLTPHSGSRRTSGADALRNQSTDVRAERPDDHDPEPDALRALAPRLGVPVLLSFWGAFVDLLKIL
jgi:hypothetical protein